MQRKCWTNQNQFEWILLVSSMNSLIKNFSIIISLQWHTKLKSSNISKHSRNSVTIWNLCGQCIDFKTILYVFFNQIWNSYILFTSAHKLNTITSEIVKQLENKKDNVCMPVSSMSSLANNVFFLIWLYWYTKGKKLNFFYHNNIRKTKTIRS